VAQALAVLDARAKTLTIPDYATTVNVPLVGAVDVAIRRLVFVGLSIPPEATRVSIEAGYYHASASNAKAEVEFEWAWSTRGGRLGGQGTAGLALRGGALDDVFSVRNRAPGEGGGADGGAGGDGDAGAAGGRGGEGAVTGAEGGGRRRTTGWPWREQQPRRRQPGGGPEGGEGGETGGGARGEGGGGAAAAAAPAQGGGSLPEIVTVSSDLRFESVQLTVHAASADWLYQALLYLFGRATRGAIEGALARALRDDVPRAANAALATLPTSAEVGGGGGGGDGGGGVALEAVFTFAVYTLNYVLVSGYTQVGEAADKGGGAAVVARGVADGPPPPPPPPAPPAPPPPPPACPFSATPQPLTPAQIGADASMATLYVHDAALSCLSWAAHASGALPSRLSISDGSVPGVPRLLANAFGALVPALPVFYAGRSLRLDVEVLEAPAVRFLGGGQMEVGVRYRTGVTVLPPPPPSVAALGGGGAIAGGGGEEALVPLPPPLAAPPRPLPAGPGADPAEALVAVLDANLTAVLRPGWEATSLLSARAAYAVAASSLPVDVLGWQAAAEWALRAAAASPARRRQMGLGALWEAHAATPVRPWFGLRDARVEVLDRWAALSADVELRAPPPPDALPPPVGPNDPPPAPGPDAPPPPPSPAAAFFL